MVSMGCRAQVQENVHNPQQASVFAGAGSFRAFRLPSPSWSWMYHLRPAPPRSRQQRTLLAQRG